MPMIIDGIEYHLVQEVLVIFHVSRQTLWRWRRDGKIPVGRKLRNHKVLFTTAEMASIRGYANSVEVVESSMGMQLRLPLSPQATSKQMSHMREFAERSS